MIVGVSAMVEEPRRGFQTSAASPPWWVGGITAECQHSFGLLPPVLDLLALG